MAATDFSTMTNAEVEQLARDLEIEGRSTMDRPALEKAIRAESKKGGSSSRISGDPEQGSARAVVYTDERQLSRTGGERAEIVPGEAPTREERTDVSTDIVVGEGATDAEAAAAAAAQEQAGTA